MRIDFQWFAPVSTFDSQQGCWELANTQQRYPKNKNKGDNEKKNWQMQHIHGMLVCPEIEGDKKVSREKLMQPLPHAKMS